MAKKLIPKRKLDDRRGEGDISRGTPLDYQITTTEVIIDDVDARAAHLTVAETEVFSGAAPTSWTDLDLSGTVGVNVAELLIKATETGDAAWDELAFRKNGDTDEFEYPTNATIGCAMCKVAQNSAFHSVIKVVTDDTGKIEWISDGGTTVTLDIISFIK